jgi:hypothetical protein
VLHLQVTGLFFRDKTGVKAGELFMSFKSIFQDVRNTVDWVHIQVLQLIAYWEYNTEHPKSLEE